MYHKLFWCICRHKIDTHSFLCNWWWVWFSFLICSLKKALQWSHKMVASKVVLFWVYYVFYCISVRKDLLHYHIVAMVFQTVCMLQVRTRSDKEVMSVWTALIHWDTIQYIFEQKILFLLLIVGLWILAELPFFDTMSCVAPMRRLLNDKGKTCYAILNSPSSSMQITLSCCSLFSQSCSAEVDFLPPRTGSCFTPIKSLLLDIH